MRMPKYEKLRNARLYGAMHQPKASRISAVLNSPLFLWVLTALFVTAAGSYFSQVQKCMSDADAAADKFDLLENERWKREYYFKHALATMKTFAEVREAKDRYMPSSSDFKSKTAWDLQVEQFHILRRAVPGDDRPFRKQGFLARSWSRISRPIPTLPLCLYYLRTITKCPTRSLSCRATVHRGQCLDRS